MYMLGALLPDNQLVSRALTKFYGISYHVSARLCARLQLHADTRVSSLTDNQITALSAYLSSPGSIPAQQAMPTAPFIGAPTPATDQSKTKAQLPPSQRSSAADDPLRAMVLESDLRRQVRENIAHHRNIGSYRGRRHMQGFPVRGQRTKSNALTAGRLNKIERRGVATMANAGAASLPSSVSSRTPSVSKLLRPLLRARFPV